MKKELPSKDNNHPNEPYDARLMGDDQFIPGGKFALTWGSGKNVWGKYAAIEKPPGNNTEADLFEESYVEYCVNELNTEIRSCAGTNSFFWSGELLNQYFEFKVIGPGKNIASWSSAEKWLLRIEENSPYLLSEKTRDLFSEEPLVKEFEDGKRFFQFKSTHFSGWENSSEENSEQYLKINSILENSDYNLSDKQLNDLRQKYADFKGNWRHLYVFNSMLSPSVNIAETVFAWNKYLLKENRKKTINLKNINLNGEDIKGISLVGVDIRGGNFKECDLSNLDLRLTNIEKTLFYNCNFSNSNFEGASEFYCNFKKCLFSSANFRDCCFRQSLFQNCDFTNSYMDNAVFSQSDLSESLISPNDSKNIDFEYTKLKNIEVRGDLQGLKLKKADLTEADLTGVKTPFVLDQNRIKGAAFAAKSKDPYSILRRTYTGPWFIIIFFLTFSSLTPNLLKTAFWASASDIEKLYDGAHSEYKEKIKESLVSLNVPTDKQKKIIEKFNKLNIANNTTWEKTNVISLALGLREGPIFILITSFMLIYNIFRGFLTIKIYSIRDEIEHTNVIPDYKRYKIYFTAHRVLNIVLYVAITVATWNAINIFTSPVYVPKL